MSYIDAIHDRETDRIFVVERQPNGKRTYNEFPANYVFYYPDRKGKFRSIFGDPVTRFSTRKRSEFEKEKRIHSGKKLFESDEHFREKVLKIKISKVRDKKIDDIFDDFD